MIKMDDVTDFKLGGILTYYINVQTLLYNDIYYQVGGPWHHY